VLHGCEAPRKQIKASRKPVSKTSGFPCNRLQHRKCVTVRF
jgi:hypothetical protein